MVENKTLHLAGYESRVVAFIDLLGTKDAASSQEKFQTLFRILSCFKNNERSQSINILEDKTGYTLQYQPEVTVFSDNMAVSGGIPADEPKVQLPNVAIAVINTVFQATNVAIRNGFLLRGAITVGELYHDSGVVFGPALCKAVELEKETELPLISISEDLFSVLSEHERQYIFEDSGRYYFDHIKCVISDTDDAKIIENILASVKDIIDRSLAHNDPKVKAKAAQYEKYYLDSIAKHHWPPESMAVNTGFGGV